MKFFIKYVFIKFFIKFPADLVTFIEEILHLLKKTSFFVHCWASLGLFSKTSGVAKRSKSYK